MCDGGQPLSRVPPTTQGTGHQQKLLSHQPDDTYTCPVMLTSTSVLCYLVILLRPIENRVVFTENTFVTRLVYLVSLTGPRGDLEGRRNLRFVMVATQPGLIPSSACPDQRDRLRQLLACDTGSQNLAGE